MGNKNKKQENVIIMEKEGVLPQRLGRTPDILGVFLGRGPLLCATNEGEES